MSLENAISTLAAALANIATAGDNIAGSINRYCELTEAQDRVMFEGFERDGKITGKTKTADADPIGDAIKKDRADAAEAKKTALAYEAAEAEAEKQKEDDARAKAKAEAAALVADAAETVAAAKAAKAAKAETKVDETASNPGDESQKTEVAKTNVGKTATYDEARAALIQGVSALGKEAVVAILHDNFNAKNIKELSDEQNAQLIGILDTAIVDGDIPF